MSKAVGRQTSWIAGISFSNKDGVANSYDFGRSIDHRTDPKSITLNPKSEKDSGSEVVDLPMWGARACSRTFTIGNTGRIYKRENGSWSLFHTAPDSQGNGLAYFPEDRALYYAQNDTFGRILDACTESQAYDNFLGSEGGTPTNTKSLDLEASSSQYASRADTTSLSITSDLTIETYIKPESLPATNGSMVLVSKWDTNSKRSYKLDITTVSNFFGDGRDGALVISTNTTNAPVDANFSGTSGAYTMTLTNAHASFASVAEGDKILAWQVTGTNAGIKQLVNVVSYSGGVLTVDEPLSISYSTSGTSVAYAMVMPQYTNVTVNSGITYTAKAWDGAKGGVLGYYANGTVTITGTQTATGKGFRGGNNGRTSGANKAGQQGENYLLTQSYSTSRSGNGGGGGGVQTNEYGGIGGAGAQETNAATSDTRHRYPGGAAGGQGGLAVGDANIGTMFFGGGGGGGGVGDSLGTNGYGTGGNGGGINLIFGATVVVTGSVVSNGSAANGSYDGDQGPGGPGGGGVNHFISQTATLGSGLITSNGGTITTLSEGGGVYSYSDNSDGRNALDYSSSFTGTTTPTLVSNQDTTLGDTDGYALRLQVSSTGSNSESYTQEIDIETAVWNRWAVTWDASASTANFYKDGGLVGTKTGALTAIHDNDSAFAIGCDFATTVAQNFYDGLMDDVRVWNDIRTASELLTNNDQILYGTEANLVAYYQLESVYTDSQTSRNNDLTASNTPTFSSDVPFSGVTTRNDQDQGLTSGSFVQGYTLATSINEGATHRQTFVPAKDPQKSITIDIDTVGTGDWTLTVHDSLNREVASKTVTNGQLATSFFEFIFDDVWRPIIGATYHFHLTSTVADGIVDTTGANDLETAYFTTHYQFLVSDAYHPMYKMLDFLTIGNERYLATFRAGDTFDPHRLTFPSEYRVRCIAYWREYIAIGCWKGTSITDYDDGRIFFWDGISDTYNHSIPVPEGGVNAMFGTQDVLFIVAGYSGEILIYTGGGSAQKFNKIPKVQRDKYTEIAPGALNMWRSFVCMGIDLNTDSSEIHKGVYTIGTAQREYPVSLGFDYPTSLGDQTSSGVSVGLVYPSGQDLFIGWKNSNTYGIDKISVSNDCYADGTVEMLISDMGSISKDKYPLILRADFEPLDAGQSIRVKYKADREDSWKVSPWEDSTNATEIRMRIPERVKEIQVACDLATTISTSPRLLGVSIETELEDSSRRIA